MTLPSSGAIFGPTPRHASRHGRRCRETGMIERLAVGRRDFVAGAAMLSAAASAGPALAAADNGAGIEAPWTGGGRIVRAGGSEEHTSEIQSLMSLSYAVFCLKQKKMQRK